MDKNPSLSGLNFKSISQSKNFQYSWLEEFPDSEWDFYYISSHIKHFLNGII